VPRPKTTTKALRLRRLRNFLLKRFWIVSLQLEKREGEVVVVDIFIGELISYLSGAEWNLQ